jgi:hypothetical protein
MKSVNKSSIFITGYVNSGTSIIAGLCNEMGYYMGEEKQTLEDQVFQYKMKGGEPKVKKYIEFLDSKYERWGFKKPCLAKDTVLMIDRLMNNKKTIFVLRDPWATSMRVSRESKPTDEAIYESIPRILDYQKELYDLAEKIAPILWVSYEKLLIRPEREIVRLADFLECELDEKQTKHLISLIRPESGHPPISK